MEIWFYHLQDQPLERALPRLVAKAVERGWRVVVQTVDDARLKAIDDLLWSYAPDSFLPHGVEGEAGAARQPVLLTTGTGNGNGAAARFCIDGAAVDVAALDGYQRVILLFDGGNEDALARARRQWSPHKGPGGTRAYGQPPGGGWSRRA